MNARNIEGLSTTDSLDRCAMSETWQRTQAASHIATMTEELVEMAREVDLGLVAYLLEIAQLEATRAAERVRSDGR